MTEKPNEHSEKIGSLEISKNADNKMAFQCVLCEEKFAEHTLMIEHFR